MTAVAIAIAWGGYAVGIWGYCLVRGYDVPFTGVFHSTWPGGTTTGSATPATGSATNPNNATGGTQKLGGHT